jgi:hypothetical protein
MPGQEVELGPFQGGINTLSDTASVADNECVDMANFDILVDGTLIGRPPIVSVVSSPSWTSNMVILGWFTPSSGTYANTPLLMGCATAASGSNIWYYTGSAWNQLSGPPGTFNATVGFQYNGYYFLVNNAVGTGTAASYSWSGTGSATALNVPSSNGLPNGVGGCVFEDRIWVFAGAGDPNGHSCRLYYSQVAPTGTGGSQPTYSSPNGGFIDVNPGDGQYITQVIGFNGSVVIFKNNSAYLLTYNTSPGSGVLRQVSSFVGANSPNHITQHENFLYVLFNGVVYEFLNYYFTPQNLKTPFATTTLSNPDSRFQECISVIGHRLVVRYYANIYVYHLRVKAWSRWDCATVAGFNPATWFRYPVASSGTDNVTYYSGSCQTSDTKVYSLTNGYNVTNSETMNCSIITKTYDFDAPDMYKKLFYWGADIASYNEVNGAVTLALNANKPTHAQLAGFTHAQLKTLGIQASPSNAAITSQTVSLTGGLVKRKFIRFIPTLRARLLSFTIIMAATGQAPSDPVQLFQVKASLSVKSKVVQTIN